MGFMREGQEDRALRFLTENGRATAAQLGAAALLNMSLPPHATEDIGRAIGVALVRREKATRDGDGFAIR